MIENSVGHVRLYVNQFILFETSKTHHQNTQDHYAFVFQNGMLHLLNHNREMRTHTPRRVDNKSGKQELNICVAKVESHLL